MTKEQTIQRIIDLAEPINEPKYRNYLEGKSERHLSDWLQELELEQGQVKRGNFTDIRTQLRREQPMTLQNMVLGRQPLLTLK